MSNPRRLLVFFITASVSLTLAVLFLMSQSQKSDIRVWSLRVPYSVDPLDFDALAHHICFRSTYASLVTEHKLGEVSGQVAESWSSSNNHKEWTFKIRSNLTFSNGDLITPEIVAKSLNRAAFLMHQRKSQSGLLEHLEGFNEILKPSNLITGISYNSLSVKLKFKKSIPDLTNKIGFGLYAIAHPSQFNSDNGLWNDKKTLISSGPYIIEAWSEDSLKLKLRENFPKELLLEKPIKSAIFKFKKKDVENSDLIIDFDDSLFIPEGYQFSGPVKSAIRYIECSSWIDPISPCHIKETRIALRSMFYQELQKNYFQLKTSFFPLAISGVKELKIPDIADKSVEVLKSSIAKYHRALKVNKPAATFKSPRNENLLTPHEATVRSFEKACEALGCKIELTAPPKTDLLPADFDFRFKMSAVLVDSPHHDIKFMFLSDHGIKLPDQTGEIKSYLKLEIFDVQKVNEMIWDQALIWPIGHMALGLWSPKNSPISLSKYNLITPPLDLQWISSQ